MVSEALIGSELIAEVFNSLGFPVMPLPGEKRSDLIQAVQLGSADALKIVCKAFQKSSPIGSYLEPVPETMPGYDCALVMSGGTFVDGSTSEFSADAPLRPPFNLFVQGGTHRSHIKLAVINALVALGKAGFLELPSKF